MDSGKIMHYLHRLNKEFSSKFPEIYPGQQTPEEYLRAQHLKWCDNDKEDEDISLNIINYLH